MSISTSPAPDLVVESIGDVTFSNNVGDKLLSDPNGNFRTIEHKEDNI
jgi:hypothetical protein